MPAGAASAFEPRGERTLTAHPRSGEGEPVVLGQVRFEPQADGSARFTLALSHTVFTDHFLSMKEFKCIGGAVELACHVPYPYAQPATVRPGDWRWLEHSLLFLYKQPREFGAKLWNGLYYRFEVDGDRLVGRPQAIDLNRISAPPERPGEPPYRPALRDDIAPGARWLDRLVIE
ncbi:MAG: hypothetical protein RLZZ524_11 [Pseudomonadota bacterium]|jgi:hypothetical protein